MISQRRVPPLVGGQEETFGKVFLIGIKIACPLGMLDKRVDEIKNKFINQPKQISWLRTP